MKVDSSVDRNRFSKALEAFTTRYHPVRSSKKYVPCSPHEVLHDFSKRIPKKIGCIILAGGQSSRMGLKDGEPKALIEVTALKKKNLLQLFFEKIVSFQKIHEVSVDVALFVSSSTRQGIEEFLLEKGTFGIDPSSLSYIEQPSLPLLTDEGTIFLDEQGAPLYGPDGNGSLFWTMKKDGLFRRWKARGIEYAIMGQIDNPLLDPFFLPLLEAVSHYQIAATAVRKRSNEERVGLFVRSEDDRRLSVIEYSELSDLLAHLSPPYTLSDFIWANITQFAFQCEWAASCWDEPLPWHIACKTRNGRSHYKMEQFFFDVLPKAVSSTIVPMERDEYFAPIKQRAGEDSLESAKQQLIDIDKKIFERLFPQRGKSQFAHEALELHPFWRYHGPIPIEDEEKILRIYLDSSGYLAAPFERSI